MPGGDFLLESTFVVRVKLATVWQITHERSVASCSQTILAIDAGALECTLLFIPSGDLRVYSSPSQKIDGAKTKTVSGPAERGGTPRACRISGPLVLACVDCTEVSEERAPSRT